MGQIFTYPMEMYVVRHVVDVSIFQTFLGMGPISSLRHYGITIVLWGLSVILASSTDDLGSILEIFGAFGASVSAKPGEAVSLCFLLFLMFTLLCMQRFRDCLFVRSKPGWPDRPRPNEKIYVCCIKGQSEGEGARARAPLLPGQNVTQ